MKKYIITSLAIVFAGVSIAYAVPSQYTTYVGTLLPVSGDSLNDIGTSTNQFRNLYLSGACIGAGCATGGGVGTSTNPFMATYFVATSTTATSTFAGAVGIGSTSPSSKLTISASSSGGSSSGALGDNLVLESSGDNYINILTPVASNSGLLFSDTTRAVGGIIYAHNGDYMRFLTGGTSEKMRITSTGEVGIGTTTPGQKLSVAGDILGNNIIGSYFTGTTTTATSTFAGGLNVAGTSGLTVLQNGNVGIGTASPKYKFDIAAQDSGIRVSDSTDSGNARLVLQANDNNGGIILGYNDAEVLNLQLSAYGASYLNGGNVGVGTTSPYAKLSVTNTGTGPSFVVEDSTSPDSTPFIVDASGNVGVGTASPSQLLEIYNNSASGPLLKINAGETGAGAWGMIAGASGNGVGTGNFGLYDFDTTAYRLVAKSNGDVGLGGSITSGTTLAGASVAIVSGNVGIGTTTPAVTLDVNGIIKTQERTSATCNALAEGGIYYDSDDSHFYGCNGTTWLQLDN